MEKEKDNVRESFTAAYLNWMWLRARQVWAEWMDEHSRRIGRKWQFAVLSVFVVFSSSGCLLLIIGVLSISEMGKEVRPAPINRITTTADNAARYEVDDDQLKARIKAFRIYMDSLSISREGRRIKDSILIARPGLLDSIKKAETIINNHK